VNAKRLALVYLDAVLRGYGQLFLCNSPVSGVLFFLGLALASPENAAWSLLGAGSATLGAFLGGARAEMASGLFGVNGALLGCAWIYFPEVGTSMKAGLTLLGSFMVVLILVPTLGWSVRTRSGITPFAIPALLAVGLNLIVLNGLGMVDGNLQRGWAEYRLGNYSQAREYFATDFSGAGWCSFQLGEYGRTELEFRSALELDSWNADAWEGLGWTSSATGHTEFAKACFRRMGLLSPLRSESSVSPRWRYVTTFQWASLLLALAGIAVHSRWSLLIAVVAVAGCAGFGLLTDPALLYNLVPLAIALGGHYLRIRPVTILWTAAMVLVMALVWPVGTAYFSTLGLPLLCIPFHILFIPSLLLFQFLNRRGIAAVSVPLGLAVTTPENVARWFQKAEIARLCWEGLRSDIDVAGNTIRPSVDA